MKALDLRMKALDLCRQPAGPATQAGQRLVRAARSAAEGGADAAMAAPMLGAIAPAAVSGALNTPLTAA
jgi:hypothetical protein